MGSETETTTTTTTTFVDTFVDNSKHNDDTEIVHKLATFSDDDDTCSFDSEEQDEKLLTPPATEEEEEEEEEKEKCQGLDDETIDWGMIETNTFTKTHVKHFKCRILVQSDFGFPSIQPIRTKITVNSSAAWYSICFKRHDLAITS